MLANIVLIVYLIGLTIACLSYVKGRKKLLTESRIIKREKNFYDYAEIFTLKSIAPEAVFSRLKARLQDIQTIKVELQLQEKRIVFTGHVCRYGFNGTLAQEIIPGEGWSLYRLCIDEYQVQYGMPDTMTLNLLYTAVERTFLDFDPKTTITTEYVQRTTKR